MRDFTLRKYRELLLAFALADYSFISFADYVRCEEMSTGRFVILRHDVDKKPFNSLAVAKVESECGAVASYYFRAVPESWDEEVIRSIAALGHEVGYHYESLTTCKGDDEAAYSDFCRNLERLRRLVEVKTICMHGSPRSPFDSKDLWQRHDYHELDILGEPYLDVDFDDVLYLTDTGRCWDGERFSVRDKVESAFQLRFHSTDDIIRALGERKMPPRVMMTTHPQRWTDALGEWWGELIVQNIKNQMKRFVVRK